MNRISKRQEKYDKLLSEVKHFKTDKALHIIADQLSWRMVMRIVNKLECIRNTGGLTDAEKGLKVSRRRKNAQTTGQLSIFDEIKENNND